jgi:NADH dehydrogenase FAD-containing subunit
VIGSASAADFDAKTVEITLPDSTTRTLPYQQLVLATGARSPSPETPWKAPGTYEETLASLHDTATKVANAQHIVVGGAGSTGIEVAGELGYEYGRTREIVLLCSGDKVAGGATIADAAASELKRLNVTIKYGARVQEARPAPGGDGKTEVVLASGEILTTDLYLPTTGLIPNTEFIPAQYLAEGDVARPVEVDEYLQVPGTEGVWACGDIVSKPRASFFHTQKQAVYVAKNVEAVLAGLKPTVAKGPPMDVFACAVGRERGVGRINGSIKMPSFMVWAAKGRTLALPMVKSYIDGSVA